MGSFYMESTQINYRRDETVKTVDQKLQELSETSAIDTDIAPVFKSTNTYAPGDMVYYRNKLYVFNVEHSGAWAAGDVTATDVTTEVSSLRSGLTDLSGVTIFTKDADLISAFRDKHNYHKMIMLNDSTKTMALLNTTDREKMFVLLVESSEMWSNHPNYIALINNDAFVGVLNIGSSSVSVVTCVKLAIAT